MEGRTFDTGENSIENKQNEEDDYLIQLDEVFIVYSNGRDALRLKIENEKSSISVLSQSNYSCICYLPCKKCNRNAPTSMETTVANTVPFNDGCIIEKWKITMIVLAKPTSLWHQIFRSRVIIYLNHLDH